VCLRLFGLEPYIPPWVASLVAILFVPSLDVGVVLVGVGWYNLMWLALVVWLARFGWSVVVVVLVLLVWYC
jgi:hypothetical protein